MTDYAEKVFGESAVTGSDSGTKEEGDSATVSTIAGGGGERTESAEEDKRLSAAEDKNPENAASDVSGRLETGRVRIVGAGAKDPKAREPG